MEKGVIEVDDRHTVRRMRAAMQGDPIRALVELITNSDDSYIRLEDEGEEKEGIIDVFYNREKNKINFAVRDYAEGMTGAEVRRSFKKYGTATSGLKKGRRVKNS